MEIQATINALQTKVTQAGAQRAQARRLAKEAEAAKQAAYGTAQQAITHEAWRNAQNREIVCREREEALADALQVVIDANGLAIEVQFYRDA